MQLGRRTKGLLLGIALGLLAAAAPVNATEFHGQVVFGGLPVPGAQATVTASQGDKTVTAVTDDQGLFTFPNLTDGVWNLTITLTGFAPIQRQINIEPNVPTPVFTLKLLTLEEIRAQDKPVLVQPGTTPLTASVPGSGAAAGGPTAPAKGKENAKGGTEQASAGAPEAPPPQDSGTPDGLLINGSVNNAATSQYSLAQAFGNARNSRSLYNWGAVLQLANSALNAKQYSVTGLDQAKPQFSNFTAGIQFQGPLKIPRLLPVYRAPNFYIGYQRSQDSSVNTQPALVPTPQQIGGDLSQLPNVQTIYAPATGLSAACLATPGVTPGAPFAGNVIPSTCISPVAQALLKFYPTPNVTGLQQYNYQQPLTSGTHTDSVQARLYRQINNKNNLNGTFVFQSTRQSTPNLFDFVDPQDTRNISTRINWDHRFSQRFSTDISYNFSRSHSQTDAFFANKQNVSLSAGITGNDQTPVNWGPPTLGFSQSSILTLSDGNSRNNRNETNSISIEAQWNRFRHNMAFGGDFRRQEFNYFQQSNPRGTLSFTGAGTAGGVTGGGSDFADFLLGLPDTSQIAYGNADKYLRQSVYDLYANDDFRVSPELSINFGLRWEYGAPVTELKDRLVNLDFGAGFASETPVLATSPVGALSGQHYPTSLMRPDKNGFAPRISLAWRPISGSSLLVRAGYGLYHDTSVYQSTAYAMANQTPGANAPWTSTSLSEPNTTGCRFTIDNPFVALPCATTVPNTFAVDPDFRVGYAQAWNVSLQRDLPAALQLVVTYTGIKGTRGVQEILPNTYPVGTADPCPACPKGFYYRMSNGNSTRESGSIDLRRRLRGGFQARGTYTFSKSLDDDYSYGGATNVASGTSSAGSPQVAQDWTHPEAQRGLSTFDQRHLLNLQLQYTTGMGLGGHALLNGWRGAIYKQWSIVANITLGSGLPFTPIVGSTTVPGSAYSNIVRPNYTGQPVYVHPPGVPTYVSADAFAAPTSGWGTVRRNSLTGPDQFTFVATMQRDFKLHDRYNLTAQINATNPLNHVTYSNYGNVLNSSQFGAVTSAEQMRTLSITLRLRH